MRKQKWYYNVKFPPAVVQEIYSLFLTHVQDPKSKAQSFEITVGPEALNFDTIEEFLAEYPKATGYSLQH
jgi:hypothetical protein